jgi:chitodextrinase
MPDTIAPSAPGAPVGQAGPSKIDLTWSAATDNVAVTNYEVSRDGVAIGTVPGTAYTDASVASTTTYSYSVVAVDAAGNRGPASAPVSVTSLDSLAPSVPGSLTATPANDPDRVRLSWFASTDDVGVTGYEVLRDGVLLATVASVGYLDTTALQGVSYAYTVRALDAAGNRSATASASAKVADIVAPTAPTNLTGSALSGPYRVRLAWAAATDNVGVTAYRVYRNGVLLATASTTTYTDYAVSRKTTYNYAVRALDAAGNVSLASATVSIRTR